MSIKIKYKDTEIGVGDVIRISQKTKDGEKIRSQIFEGTVIKIKGGENPSVTLRKIGVQQIGIEKIFPLNLTNIDKIEVTKKGHKGSRHAKLYYIRNKSRREIESIYSRAKRKK